MIDETVREERQPVHEERAEIAGHVARLFQQCGAYRQGHFKLKSGRHSERYLEKFQVLQWPKAVSELCRMIADRAWEPGGKPAVEVVIGPTTGGVILAYEVARQLGVRGIFAEQVSGEDGSTRRVLRRGFRIEEGERVLLVDDVVTTGASLTEMLPLIEQVGGRLTGIVVLVDRTGTLASVTSPQSGRSYPAEALWSLSLPTYEPGAENCPGCAEGLELEAPGSSGATPPVEGSGSGSV